MLIHVGFNKKAQLMNSYEEKYLFAYNELNRLMHTNPQNSLVVDNLIDYINSIEKKIQSGSPHGNGQN